MDYLRKLRILGVIMIITSTVSLLTDIMLLKILLLLVTDIIHLYVSYTYLNKYPHTINELVLVTIYLGFMNLYILFSVWELL